MTDYDHVPAMLSETLQFLRPEPGKIIVDGTLGGAGHARALVEKILPDGLLIGIDQDPDAVESARRKLEPHAANIRLFHDNFSQLRPILDDLGLDGVDGILLDLGLSLHHLRSSQRGFSFKGHEVLDMRMDRRTKTTAKDLVNQMKEESLADLFRDFGEERYARQIAAKIAETRKRQRIEYSDQLADLVMAAIPGFSRHHQKIHPATRVFMALRIAVNGELGVLERFMEDLPGYLHPSGRFCVLSYHSLEDRIVKHRLRALEKGCTCPPEFPTCVCHKKPVMRVISKKAFVPTQEEVQRNPMARSVKMRVGEKL